MPALADYHDTTKITEYLKEVKGHLAFDIGANGGMVTRLLAPHFDEVVAVEPADSFDELANLPEMNVRPVHAAVSEETGKVTLSRTERCENIGELVTPTDGPITKTWGAYSGDVEVRAITLDYMALNYGNPDFIKIDVEGHESYVIRGGHTFFSMHSPRLCIEIHDNKYGTEIRAMLPGYAWELFEHEAYQHSSQSAYRNNHYWLIGTR